MTRKDTLAILVIGAASGLLAIPILKNLDVMAASPFAWLALVAGMTVCAYAALWATIRLAAWKPVFAQLGKFASVGVLNTLIDFGILNALSAMFQVFSGGMVALFNVLGFLVATVNSYFWNKHWTFPSGTKKTAAEFFEFVGVSAVGIGLNTAILFAMTTLMSPLAGMSEPQWENIAKLLATVVSLVWNFLGYKFVVFRSAPPAP